MKKLLLSVLTLAGMAFSASAITNMCVEQEDGTIVRYDVEKVKQVYYEEVASADSSKSDTAHGVTVSGKVGIYTYVDLGLESGTKWATYNVGASKPTEYGDYFAWGETSPKESYDFTNYKFSKDSCNTYTKYVMSKSYGIVDSLTTLLAEDDAATANWGADWRMPTVAEQQELIDGCDWEWTDDFNGSGVAGRVGTSKSNGNTVFLPAACYRRGTVLGSTFEIGGYYWSSSLSESYLSNANYLYFIFACISWNSSGRYFGHSVRAVVK